ncbi:MAG TPA: ATP-binding protein [Candidatus Omnitrophota bacterium]|nr:ATP-binding protein [Candidatus Omnitrophota bacterium]
MNTNRLLKVRDLIQRERKPSFLGELDLYGVEEGILTGVSGALGRGLRLGAQDLLLKDPAEIVDHEKKIRKFLNGLPEGIILHFIVRAQNGDEAVVEEYRESIQDKAPLAPKFVESKISGFLKNPFLKREVFLFVIVRPPSCPRRRSFLPDLSVLFGKKAHRLSESEFQTAKNELLKVSSEVGDGFRDLGFQVELLKDEEILKYCYELLNPYHAEKVAPFDFHAFEKEDGEDPSSLRSKLLLSAPVTQYDSFFISRYFHSALNLLQLPESTDLKCMRNFEEGLGKEYFLSLTVEVPEQDREKSEIRRQGNFARARSLYSRTKDYDAIVKAGESDELLSEIAESSDKLFYISLAVMVRACSREEALERSTEVFRSFRRLGDATGLEDHMNHDRLFLSFLPLQGTENPLAFLVRSASLAHLLPLQASWPGTEKIGLLLKTRRDEPLRFDLFDARLQAKHAVMLGTTGSGKSFFTNHLLLHFLMESPAHDVIVIDLGGSYRKLAGVLKGSYLEVECSEKFALNPFPAKKVLFPETGDADSTFLQFLKELLQTMIAPARVWSSSEKMILERAISEVYRDIPSDGTPLLGDVEKTLRSFGFGDEEDRKLAYQFAKELSLFTQGEYGKILNRPGCFDFNARFTVFDLRKISQYPELQEILLLIIPFALKRKFENLDLKKILVLDECWHLLKETQGTDLIELFYRTARKFNGAVLSISQNPEDFLEAKIAGVMVNNSPVKYILRLKKGHDQLSAFGLNENEIRACGDLEVKPGRYSEIFIKFDDQGVIAKLEPNPIEYWTATTDPVDLAEERRLRLEKPGIPDLEILETLAARFPNGVKKAGGGT